jgi:hypothetical protein
MTAAADADPATAAAMAGGMKMLPEHVLAELCRNTPLRQKVVTTAWASLSTESKLQLIDAIQRSETVQATPGWLVGIALMDPARIVRYWAARLYHFSNHDAITVRDYNLPGESPQELARYKKAAEDSSELVRLAATAPSSFFRTLSDARSHTERLFLVRHERRPEFEGLVSWLTRQVDSGGDPVELAEVVRESLLNPALLEALKQCDADGLAAEIASAALKKAWDLVARAPAPLQMELADRLPTKAGTVAVTAQQLAKLPGPVVSVLLYGRGRGDQVIDDLVQVVAKSPTQFSKEVQWTLRDLDDVEGLSRRSDQRERNAKARPDPELATLETVLGLRRDVDALRVAVTRLG